jgi:2-C-methyl-D-erythritol 4-phosphate cytidylyltransferase/2-C-methyl-D-erythritol 2,4-cyclodiphosphate synthase
VVVAAGSSSRFGEDKLAVRVAGVTILDHAVSAVQSVFAGAPLALVVRPDQVNESRKYWQSKQISIVPGGRRRQDSVQNGCRALGLGREDVVAIHDGARPFVPKSDVEAVVDMAATCGAAILVAPVVDTVKRLAADGSIVTTVPREDLARALTPQAFRFDVLEDAWMHGGDADFTDEAALIEANRGKVMAVPGDTRNIKVTQPEDIGALAEVFPHQVRVGQGFDVHPFAPGRKLWLCGVEIPAEDGLAGHSDADVALHAVTDAVLGACGAGDIGQHFPPSEDKWRGASSNQFVQFATQLAAKRGLAVVNCDLTLLAEKPRIGPYRELMRARLAEILGISADDVNIKATTCEGLGFVGRREGIVATAVVSLESA